MDGTTGYNNATVRTMLHAGGVYLTFSGDPSLQYRFAKVIRVRPGDMCVKLYHPKYPDRPSGAPDGDVTIMWISVDMFLAWGPPKFPIHLYDEAVTSEEATACDREDDGFRTDERLDPATVAELGRGE